MADGTTYWTPVSTDLLGQADWQLAGLELLALGGFWSRGVRLAQFRDPHAPAELEGEYVEPQLQTRDGGTVTITGYSLLNLDGQTVRHLPPIGQP